MLSLPLVRASLSRQPWQTALSTSIALSFRRNHGSRNFARERTALPLVIRSKAHDVQAYQSMHRRSLSTSLLASILTPPSVFVGLVVALWTWKCLMMIIFQDKIIYMPSVPPFSRQETIESYAGTCKPAVWQEQRIKSSDGTKLSLCIGRIPEAEETESQRQHSRRLVILYFQGNASSTPPRLPMLSNVLKDLHGFEHSPICSIIALSYRGFWRSSGRASQIGIEKDAAAALQRAFQIAQQEGAGVLVWGQSIGAGIAANVLMRHLRQPGAPVQRVVGLLLETPFSSIRNMLVTLYPQKWLPYRYLWPFLWNWWDTNAALKQLASTGQTLAIQIVAAGKDEVVPPSHGPQLGALCHSLGLKCNVVVVPNAYHHETSIKWEGRSAIVEFIKQCGATDTPIPHQM